MEKTIIIAVIVGAILYFWLKEPKRRIGIEERVSAEKEKVDAFFQNRRHEGAWVVQSNMFLRKGEWKQHPSVIHSVRVKNFENSEVLTFEVDCCSEEVTLIHPGDIYSFHERTLAESGPNWGKGYWDEVSIPLRNKLVPLLVSRAPLELKMSAGKA
jgi:hypothetical protein